MRAVIPTLNEAATIAGTIASIPRDVVDEIIVADSSSRDGTAAIAQAAGARVVTLTERGYGRPVPPARRRPARAAGSSCSWMATAPTAPTWPDMLVAPIRAGTHDFVIGSRVRGEREPGSMSWHQVLAGRLAGWLMSPLYGVRYTDMCAFRAIRRDALARLDMRETTYGWNIEMQMKAARAGLRILELPVPYRRRAGGSSKVPVHSRQHSRRLAHFADHHSDRNCLSRSTGCRHEKGVTPAHGSQTTAYKARSNCDNRRHVQRRRMVSSTPSSGFRAAHDELPPLLCFRLGFGLEAAQLVHA